MNKRCGRIVSVAAIVIAVLVPTNLAFAGGSAAAKKLSFEWWQWVISIPASENPMLDSTGEKCMVGQHGDTWFLAGSWIGSVTRTCAIPANVKLFFPVLNYIGADTPGQCGQGPSRSSNSWRTEADMNMDAAPNMSVTLDTRSAGKIVRVQSKVFAVSVPEDNAFVAAGFFCPPGDPLVAGIYSPAVDDGYYMQLNPLSVGQHTLIIQVGRHSVITYILEVEPVALQ